MTDPPRSPSRRHRLAISLRVLMIALVPVACWLAWQTNKART
jgi:hypothetical protein